MRLEMTGSFDADGSAASSNDLLFLGFHGYSNDESGMVRIINAICATGSPVVAADVWARICAAE